MSDIRLHIPDVDFAHDEETREARHELLASFLGAYADNELPPETRSQIDAHLTGCARCRRELGVHRVLRDRLGSESVPAASAALRERIAASIKRAAPPALTPEPRVAVGGSWRPRIAPRVWVAAGALAIVSVSVLSNASTWLTSQTGAASASIISASTNPLFAEILADYRRVMAGNLIMSSRVRMGYASRIFALPISRVLTVLRWWIGM